MVAKVFANMHCIQKVFRPLDFFHNLLRYSLILKMYEIIFFIISQQSIPHNDKANFFFLIVSYLLKIKTEIPYFASSLPPCIPLLACF